MINKSAINEFLKKREDFINQFKLITKSPDGVCDFLERKISFLLKNKDVVILVHSDCSLYFEYKFTDDVLKIIGINEEQDEFLDLVYGDNKNLILVEEDVNYDEIGFLFLGMFFDNEFKD